MRLGLTHICYNEKNSGVFLGRGTHFYNHQDIILISPTWCAFKYFYFNLRVYIFVSKQLLQQFVVIM